MNNPIHMVMSWVKSIHNAHHFHDMLRLKAPARVNTSIGWDLPPTGWIKLNTEGAFWSTNLKATAGGVLRDHQGVWLAGFSSNLGNCSVT